jgi:uncharacterized membrane protein
MLLLVWIHLLAALLWIGGLLFLSLIVVPLFKQEPFSTQCRPFFKAVALRFRSFVWGAIAVLLITGPLLLNQRLEVAWPPAAWPRVLQVKLTLVCLLLLLTALHDVALGPRVGRILAVPEARRSDRDRRLVHSARWAPRLSLLIALGILFCAVMLVRT